MDLREYIRDVPDFPSPGILFRDITPLLKSPEAFDHAIDRFADVCSGRPIDAVCGIEARGFLFAAPLALRLGKPLVPVRKAGKLPSRTVSVTYSLEYGEAAVEIHADAVSDGQRVLIVDDVLATGGTLAAAAELVERAGGLVAGLAVLIELTALNGRARLAGYDLHALVRY
jgi:adenine phosphoribosyltransferase